MNTRIHAIAGAVALLTISAFWLSTVTSELFGSHAQITSVKTAVLWGMLLLIPAMATAGATGFSLAKKRRGKNIETKQKRMKIIAANGLLILLPSAVFLALRAQAGMFDGWFYTIQALEVLAGATNITLLSQNMRDGLAMTRRRRAVS
ncbi:MAG: hypothetical protein GY952_00355 [Rhodobacteraceae bacterium]|nr:hypothetical protein [Paracoccaceae bacterium]